MTTTFFNMPLGIAAPLQPEPLPVHGDPAMTARDRAAMWAAKLCPQCRHVNCTCEPPPEAA